MMKRNETYQYPVALTIAGSDSGGGAGIQADLKTFSALGVFGTSAITAITAQNTKGVRGIQSVTPDMLKAQIEAVLEDFDVKAIKIGMLHNIDIVHAVADTLVPRVNIPIILDPVMVATSGSKLLEDNAIEAIIRSLFPHVTVITPNLSEAELLSGQRIKDTESLIQAGQRLQALGCKAVLIKGGHFTSGSEMIDRLFIKDKVIEFTAPIVETYNTHGTGCTLSSAIAAYMALGEELTVAISLAKQYITSALQQGANVHAGHGHGPVNHFFNPVPLHKIPLEHVE